MKWAPQCLHLAWSPLPGSKPRLHSSMAEGCLNSFPICAQKAVARAGALSAETSLWNCKTAHPRQQGQGSPAWMVSRPWESGSLQPLVCLVVGQGSCCQSWLLMRFPSARSGDSWRMRSVFTVEVTSHGLGSGP